MFLHHLETDAFFKAFSGMRNWADCEKVSNSAKVKIEIQLSTLPVVPAKY
jgi:hypothetical protein